MNKRFEVVESGVFGGQWIVWDNANGFAVSDGKWTSLAERTPIYFTDVKSAESVAAEMTDRVAA